MFNTGSKYFLGLTGLSLVATLVYLFLVNPTDLGAVALTGVLVASATMGGFALFTRDGDADTPADASAASAPATGNSMWPAVFALGLATVLVGMATVPAVFIVGIAVLCAGAIEWAIQDWADRASADSTFNNFVRHRAIGSIEYPGLAVLILAVVALAFSRIMLAASKGGAAIIFIVVAAAILLLGFLVSFKPGLRGKVTSIVVTVGVTALVASGVATALAGERAELAEASKEDHFSAEHRECGAEKAKYFDKHGNNSVALKSAVLATITVEGGKVYAQAVGLEAKVDTITIPRSNASTILFRNLDAKEHRMVIHLGEQKVAETGVVEKIENCTQLTGKNQENALTVKISKPSIEQDYSITVPDAEGEIKVVVP